MKPIETEIKEPKTLEQIASEIKSLSEAIKKLNNSPLKRRAVVVLLRDSMGGTPPMTLANIERVLDASADLHRYYIKP